MNDRHFCHCKIFLIAPCKQSSFFSMFFEYSLKLPKDLPMPLVTIDSLDVRMLGFEVIRYKYKFFNATKNDNKDLNQYVMCYLRGKTRKIVNFHVSPPENGDFYLKIYAKPEEEIQHETDTLDHVATFHIIAPSVSKIDFT